MRIFVSIKQAGKHKEYITKKELILENVTPSLRVLIKEIVHINVKEYNSKIPEPSIIKYLCKDEIENEARNGKVGFGDSWNHQPVDLNKAVDAAILAFEDGIFRVFIGECEVQSLDEQICLKENDVLTFIRFTMLAGRMW